jgi:hypothetical protein
MVVMQCKQKDDNLVFAIYQPEVMHGIQTAGFSFSPNPAGNECSAVSGGKKGTKKQRLIKEPLFF